MMSISFSVPHRPTRCISRALNWCGSDNKSALTSTIFVAATKTSSAMAFDPTCRSISNEGCGLQYWYQGTGPLLILIPGGGGIGKQFNAIFPYLAERFTVCTLDRRQTANSKVEKSVVLNPAQQARDLVAIMKDLGFEKTSIFGNSGGGVICLQFAVSYPEVLEHVMVHEAPTTALLPDRTYHLNRAFQLLDIFNANGVEAAYQEFRTHMKGYEGEGLQLESPSLADMENFWQYEFLIFTIYCPDLRPIVENKVSIAVFAGEKSDDAFYARTTFPQAKILSCPRFLVPGHHGGYEAEPAAFSRALLSAFHEMEERRTTVLEKE